MKALGTYKGIGYLRRHLVLMKALGTYDGMGTYKGIWYL